MILAPFAPPRRVHAGPFGALLALCAVLACAPATAAQSGLGLSLRPDPGNHGYSVRAIEAHSVGALLGLEVGDVLVDASFGDGPPVTLCPDEPNGTRDLGRALSLPATHLGRLRPSAPPHAQYARLDVGAAVERHGRREREREARRPPERGTPPVAGSGAGDGRPAAPAQAPPVRLRPATITDPELGGLESHTLLTPEGWRLEGGPIWNLATATNLVTLDLRLADAALRQVRVLPNRLYTFTDNPQIAQQMGGRPGQTVGPGTTFQAPPESPSQHVLRDLVPLLRPGAGEVRVLASRPAPAVLEQYTAIYAPLIEQARQMDAEWRMQDGSRAWVSIDAGHVRVAYREDGQSYEEEFFVAYLRNDTRMSGRGLMPDTFNSSWQRIDGSSARAPEGALDALLPLAISTVQSVRATPRWSAVLAEMHTRISSARHQANMEQLRRQREELSKRSESLVDLHFEGWKKRQATEDRLQRSLVNSIHGVDDFVRSDGTRVSLPDGYDRVFYSPTDGGYILTNDSLLQPNVDLEVRDWQPVGRAGR